MRLETLDWYLLFHDSRCREPLISFIESLSSRVEAQIEVYSPMRVRLFPRRDRPTPKPYEVVLFPGYTFLRFDFNEVHFDQITSFYGVYRFVQFGGIQASVSAEKIIKLKSELERYRTELLQKAPVVIEMHPSQRTSHERAISFIVRENSAPARIAGWLAYMNASDAAARAGAKQPKMKMAF